MMLPYWVTEQTWINGVASFDSAAFDTQAFDVNAWDLEAIVGAIQQILYLASEGTYTQVDLQKVALLYTGGTEFFDETSQRDVYLANGSNYIRLDV